jgi:tetratricopeptide (TPR) repeat protein/tRNA A-37 threonylcarbamoyl transferase component Bud32
MTCPRCGRPTSVDAGRCADCGTPIGETAATGTGLATGVLQLDTTGLPPGATFGASTSLGTGASTSLGSAAPTGDQATAAGSGSVPTLVGPLKVGQSFGPRYHIIKLLGAGGMGAVYRAWDAELGVAVALKVIRVDQRRAASSEEEKRFKQELLLARQVTHKNVVRIHDLGEIEGIKYITMPYVQGSDLASVLRHDGKMPIAETLPLARQIAAGLQAAHEAGVVHRDLKPANIMISGAGDERQALIMDFGISASADSTASGAVVGTLEYMAPEQAKGNADARSDIYAYGLILYEMLTGPRAIATANVQERLESMRQRFADGIPPLRSVDPAIPEPVEALIAKCTAVDAAARYESSAELAAALAAIDDDGELLPIHARVSRRTMTVAAAVVAASIWATYFVGRRMAPPPVKHPVVSVLVTDFENASGDAALDTIGGQALSIALDGAPYVALYPARDARAVAKQLSKDQSDRLTDETGRLIARREGINVLVEGTIEKSGGGYRLSARALDPVSNGTVVSATANASDRPDVLKAIQTLAARVREALGESKSEMDKVAAAETFTAGSLDAMQAYARAQDLVNTGKVQDALAAYQEAIDHDPQMGRAYSGMAIIYRNLGQMDKAQGTFKEALKYVDRMSDREKYRTLGAYYFSITRNYPKAIETYETLLQKYPNDQASLGNLAFAYAAQRNFTRAVEISRQLAQLYPKNILVRTNYASYALYAGDFDDAINQSTEVLKQNPTYQFAFLPRALAYLSKGDGKAGLDTYGAFEQLNAFGASVAKLGIADFAIYQGRYPDAVAALAPAIAIDEKARETAAAAAKYVALADAQMLLGHRDAAAAAARRAAALGTEESVLFPAALALIASGHEEEARAIADKLGRRLENEPRSYARLVDAEIYRVHGRLPDAIDDIREAQKRHDSWWSRYLLGRLYEEVPEPHHAEALAELELAIKRRGEAADAFLADTPTLRYVPPAYYWLGRAQEGMQATNAARRSYEQFLSIKSAAANDPLVEDAKSRNVAPSR